MTFRAEARAELVDRLMVGKKVNRLTLRDLIEADLAGERCRDAEREVSGLLVMDEPDRSLYVGRYLDRLINEWLDKNEDEIEELAAEFRQDYMESQRAA